MIVIENGLDATNQLKTSDRSFNYGDGCFTTILVKDSFPVLFSRHIKRLQTACEVLAIDGVDFGVLEERLSYISHIKQYGICKVHISRGQGGRGYAPSDDMEPFVYLSYFAYPSHYFTWQQQGIDLGVSSVRLGLNPLLAGIKHCNRLEQVLIKRRLAADGLLDVDDVLVTDVNDNVVEASSSNLFYYLDGKWFTPPIVEAGVQGVVRDTIIQDGVDSLGIFVDERRLTLTQLAEVKAMVLTNAVMMAVAVKTCRYQDKLIDLDVKLGCQFAEDVRALLLDETQIDGH